MKPTVGQVTIATISSNALGPYNQYNSLKSFNDVYKSRLMTLRDNFGLTNVILKIKFCIIFCETVF